MPGIVIIRFSTTSSASAAPNLTFNCSAWCCITVQPSLMSEVITLPPNGTTAVWRMMPSWKIVMSVVPPPMSTRATPASFSSSLRTAIAEAIGSRVMLSTFKPVRSTQRWMLLEAEICPVMMWKFASKRTPLMPIGSVIPCSLSTVYSCGMACKILSPGGNTSLYMSVTSFWMSFWLISVWSLSRVRMPRCCKLLMCCPAMPTWTRENFVFAIRSAEEIASIMALTVFSILVTTPRITPTLSTLPTPKISSLPYSFLRPATAQTFVVPMSSATTKSVVVFKFCSFITVMFWFATPFHSLAERVLNYSVSIFCLLLVRSSCITLSINSSGSSLFFV